MRRHGRAPAERPSPLARASRPHTARPQRKGRITRPDAHEHVDNYSGQGGAYCAICRERKPAAVSASLASMSPIADPPSRVARMTAPMASPPVAMGAMT